MCSFRQNQPPPPPPPPLSYGICYAVSTLHQEKKKKTIKNTWLWLEYCLLYPVNRPLRWNQVASLEHMGHTVCTLPTYIASEGLLASSSMHVVLFLSVSAVLLLALGDWAAPLVYHHLKHNRGKQNVNSWSKISHTYTHLCTHRQRNKRTAHRRHCSHYLVR